MTGNGNVVQQRGGGQVLTFGSLFSGIGGIDLGLERAGWTCKWQVEIDPFCRKVLEKHWPHVPKFGDIKELTGNELTRVDLLAGGFPCQDLSLAGKGAGLAGERSGLWFEYLRIICTLRPRWILVENVPGLFVRGIDTVLGGLAEAGYDSTWFSIQAADFGAPHRRERVCILAHTDTPGLQKEGSQQSATGVAGSGTDVADPQSNYIWNGGEQGASGANSERQTVTTGQRSMPAGIRCSSNRSHENVANTEEQRLSESQGGSWREKGFPRFECNGFQERGEAECRATQSLLGRVFNGFSRGMERYRWPAGPTEEQYDWEPPRVAKGIKGRVPRLKGLGNAVVPAKAELIGWIIREVDCCTK